MFYIDLVNASYSNIVCVYVYVSIYKPFMFCNIEKGNWELVKKQQSDKRYKKEHVV